MRRRVGIALALAVVISAVVWWRWQRVHANGNHAIRGSGIIEITEVDVAFEVSGTVAERYVDEGRLLDKGEPIARLDDREYRLQVDRAAAAKAAAEARYELVVKGPRGQETEQALAAVDAAEAELGEQQRGVQRNKKVHDKGVVSKSELGHISSAMAGGEGGRGKAPAGRAMRKGGGA